MIIMFYPLKEATNQSRKHLFDKKKNKHKFLAKSATNRRVSHKESCGRIFPRVYTYSVKKRLRIINLWEEEMKFKKSLFTREKALKFIFVVKLSFFLKKSLS